MTAAAARWPLVPDVFDLVGRSLVTLMGRWGAHRAAMAHPSFERLSREWDAVAHTLSSRDAFVALAAAEPCMDQLALNDLGDLVDAVRGSRRSLSPVAADRVVAAMVARQELHPLLGLAVVVALLPGLVEVGRRLEWGSGGPWGHPEEFSGELVSTAWEVVTEWAGRRREFMAPALLGAVRKRLFRLGATWRKELAERADAAELADLAGSSQSAAEELARVLEAATGWGVSRRDVAIVYGHRVLGLTMGELSALSGSSRQSLDRRQRSATRRLCA
jgi:hypothetical protein